MSNTKSPEIPGGEIRHALKFIHSLLNGPKDGSAPPWTPRQCMGCLAEDVRIVRCGLWVALSGETIAYAVCRHCNKRVQHASPAGRVAFCEQIERNINAQEVVH